MEYEPKTYFKENEEQSVKGFTIVDTHEGDEEYLIAEKWMKGEDDGRWMQYYIPEAQLLARVEDNACEEKAELTQEQYEAVCQKIDNSNVTPSPVETA
jgi:hypothetical protein